MSKLRAPRVSPKICRKRLGILVWLPGRIRTSDLTVNSRPLYRLSYRGAIQNCDYVCYTASSGQIKRFRPKFALLRSGQDPKIEPSAVYRLDLRSCTAAIASTVSAM